CKRFHRVTGFFKSLRLAKKEDPSESRVLVERECLIEKPERLVEAPLLAPQGGLHRDEAGLVEKGGRVVLSGLPEVGKLREGFVRLPKIAKNAIGVPEMRIGERPELREPWREPAN